jgi:hypothetical protein
MPFNSILEYVEGPTGLNWTLYPVQRFILKLYYGLELDDTHRAIRVPDMFNEQERFRFTELEYLRFLFGEGRCSVSDMSTLPRSGLILSVGRRTGKNLLAGFIATYTIVQLLQMMNPHPVFELNPRQRLNVLCFSMNTSLCNELTSSIRYNIENCRYLQDAIVTNSRTSITFETFAGRQAGYTHGNLGIRSDSNASRTRGFSAVQLIVNELAYMTRDREVYDSLMPTINPPGRYIILSTPREASGAFYSAFTWGMQNHNQDSPLALQIPTWEIQPNVGDGYLRAQYELDPHRFLVEFGAVWEHHGRLITIDVTI